MRIRDLRQLFDSLDPAPFLARDLDDDLAEYVESCAAEIPRHLPLRLVVHVTEPVLPAGQRDHVRESVRNHSRTKRRRPRSARGRLPPLRGT